MSEDNGIKFLEISCQVCGSNDLVSSSNNVVFCKKCGQTFKIEKTQSNKSEDDSRSLKIQNLFVLAEKAMEGHDYPMAFDYFGQILKLDTKDARAWLELGIMAAFISKPGEEKFDLAIVCINEAFKLEPSWDVKEYSAQNILIALGSYLNDDFRRITENTKEYVQTRMLRQKYVVTDNGSLSESLGRALGAGLGQAMSENMEWNSEIDTISIKFLENEAVLAFDVLNFAWELSPTEEVGKQAFEVIQKIFDTNLLNEKTKRKFHDYIDKIINNIMSKFNNLTRPTLSSEKKGDGGCGCNTITPIAIGVILFIIVIVILSNIGM